MYAISPDAEKEILFTRIVQYIEDGVLTGSMRYLWAYSNEAQKDVLLPLAMNGKEEISIDDIHFFYTSANQPQKDLLIPFIITTLEQKKMIPDLYDMYCSSTDEQKQKLLPHVLHNVFGYPLNMGIKTQTGEHLFAHFHEICKDSTRSLFGNSELKQVLPHIMQSEAEYVKKGHYVFYHAQIWEIFLREFVYTTLSNIKHAQQAEHYFFTRFPFDGTCSENATLIHKERNIRKDLINYGRFDPYRPMLLFLNYALFGNTTNIGSSSFHYFVYNFNVTNPGISSRDVFAQFGLDAFYDNNKDEIQLLEKKFLQLTRHGNLLQIAIPKEHLKKHLYLTTAGGPKIKAQILKDVFNYAYNKDGEIVDVIENRVVDTDDVVELIETLKDDPNNIDNSDQKEFVWIVTADTIHKAKQDGVEIKSFNTADPEKLKEVTDELENLLKEKLADHWKQPQPTPWECYKMHKQK